MRTITVSSIIRALPEVVWGELQKSATLEYVSEGVVKPRTGESFPLQWQVNELYHTTAFGGRYRFLFTLIDHTQMIMRTIEGEGPIRSWRHQMRVEETADGYTRYTDVVELDAGFLTWPLSLWVKRYYQSRHRHWPELLRSQGLLLRP